MATMKTTIQSQSRSVRTAESPESTKPKSSPTPRPSASIAQIVRPAMSPRCYGSAVSPIR